MVPWPFDGKALPRSGGEKSLVSQFEIVAEAFLESFELLEEYVPIWYTEEHHQRALNAWRILQGNPSHALGSERRPASQPCKYILDFAAVQVDADFVTDLVFALWFFGWHRTNKREVAK